jgi:thymidylate synthase ThyX
MSPDRQVYLLDPQKLPPETIAVTFAKTSRSPQSFREIAAELTDEKSAEFHEKWVVGYGHASVAEHAVLHIAVENISRLAVECLESNRLASYTEKSTRYQKWDQNAFYIPEEIRGSLFVDDYLFTIQHLLESYQKSIPLVKDVIASENPRRSDESEAAWDRRIRSDYIDVCRYFLPAACLANVGVTINARALEHAITKMLSHPLAEVRATGLDIKYATQAVVPTLVKYAEPSVYLDATRRTLEQWIAGHKFLSNTFTNEDWCSCIWMDPDLETRLLAAALFPHASQQISYKQIFKFIYGIPVEDQCELAKAIFGSLGKYDIPLRELEHSAFTFEVILDQGAYFELKRHRMMTQSVQTLSTDLGYAIPSAISRAGMEDPFKQAMQMAIETHHRLSAISPHVAAYVLPNAFNRRVMLSMNLRSAEHLVSLRTAPNAHFAIRRIAQRLSEEIRHRAPLFGEYLRTDPTETWQQIENLFFTQTAFSKKG